MKVVRFFDEHLEEYFLVTSLVVLVVIVFLQVVMRYVFQNSLTWSEELARYLFIWQVWIGASLATKRVRHLKVEILPDSLSPKGKKAINILATLISIGFVLFLLLKSADITSTVFRTNQITPALGISMAIPYAAVPVGMTLMTIRLLQRLYIEIRNPISEEVQ